jgi:N-acetylglucosaminyl-diphospho-decaprenol L-rhamnosyltransferase
VNGSVAVVTIAHGRHDHLRRQLCSVQDGTARPDHVVVVAMGDPRLKGFLDSLDTEPDPCVVPLDADGPLPLARARNLAASTALDLGAEVLVFLDVDCIAGPELVAAYAQVVRRHPEVIWSGPVTYLEPGLLERQLARAWLYDDPHPARPAPSPGELQRDADPDLFWSLSFAVHRDTWRASGGFCEEYVGYGAEDTDFAHQTRDRGLELGWVGSARAYHQHHPTEDPPVRHVDDIVRNATVFHRRWGRWPMLGWLEEFERMGLVRGDRNGWVRL